jgi:iron complex transport system permease protein
MQNKSKLAVLLLLLLITIFVGLSTGSVPIPVHRIIPLVFGQGEALQLTIIQQIRIPRIILAIAVGGGLSLAGVLFQALFRNPLVEPYTLGISGGAALGASLYIAFLGSIPFTLGLPLSGFIGALLVILLLFSMGFRSGSLRLGNILLTGVMISFIASALVMFILSVSRSRTITGILFWTMGSLDRQNMALARVVLILSIGALGGVAFIANKLNALMLGEESAASLGIQVERLKKAIFLLGSLLTGFCVAAAGIIGFVGLVVPHFVRMYISRDHRLLPVASYISGGIFLILCDTLSRIIIAPAELPVGVITGMTGGILFVYVLNRRHIQL